MLIFGSTLLDITASYVQVDNVKYEFRTPLKAVDTCFKIFYTLDAAYQKEYQAIFFIQKYFFWVFIQKYFYDLHLKEDNNEGIREK